MEIEGLFWRRHRPPVRRYFLIPLWVYGCGVIEGVPVFGVYELLGPEIVGLSGGWE
ncbi:hypothetical protein ES703_56515 [subsurface metagenome]